MKKKMDTWKKTLLIIVTILIAVRIGYIAVRGETDKEYYTSASYDMTDAEGVPCRDVSQTFKSSQKRLNSLELIFDNIAEDKAGAAVLCIYADEELIYQTNLSFANINNREWKKVFVNAQMLPNQEYRIALSVSEECTQIPEVLLITDGYAPEMAASSLGDRKINGQIAVKYGYLRQPGRAERLVMISLWLFLWGFLFAVLYYSDEIREKGKLVISSLEKQAGAQRLSAVLELILCTVIINSSGIEFQEPVKVILYVISLLSVMKSAQKKAYVQKLADCIWKKTLLYLLYAYAAFSLTGQRIFIYPLDLKITAAGLFVYASTFVWFIPVVRSVLYALEQAGAHSFTDTAKLKTWQFALLCILILLVPAAYNLYAYNPGISSPDTAASMITNAQHLYGMFDWHPAFYCMVLRLIQKVWNSVYAVVFVQYFFWAYVVTELMLYLRKKGMKESVLTAAVLFTGLNAGNYIHINTVWKDIPYTLSLLWALVLTAKLSVDFEEYKGKWYIYLELIIALTGACLYRKNGVVSFIVIAAALALVLRKNRKLTGALAVSAALIFTVKGPVYDYLHVVNPGKYGMYIGLGQDILGVYYAGGEISGQTLQMINVMTGYNNAEYSYEPTWSSQSMGLDVDATEFIFNYIDTFVKNPVLMARAVIDREDALWDIFQGQNAVLGCVNYTGTMDASEEWSAQYPSRKYVSLYPAAAAASAYTASSQWISAIEWRCGLFTLFGCMASVFLLCKKGLQKYCVIAAPLAGHICSLLLSTGWSDFRYFWPLNLMNMALLLFVPVLTKCRDGSKKEKRNEIISI